MFSSLSTFLHLPDKTFHGHPCWKYLFLVRTVQSTICCIRGTSSSMYLEWKSKHGLGFLFCHSLIIQSWIHLLNYLNDLLNIFFLQMHCLCSISIVDPGQTSAIPSLQWQKHNPGLLPSFPSPFCLQSACPGMELWPSLSTFLLNTYQCHIIFRISHVP